MKHALESLRRHQFFSLASGVLAANLLSLLTMPVLTRWYPVEAFGMFAVFWSLSTIIGLFSTLRIEVALPIIKDEKEAREVGQVALMLAVLIALMFLPLWYFTPLPSWLKIPFDPYFGFYVAVCAIFNAVLQIQNQLAVKLGHMKALSMRNVIEKVIAVVLSLVLVQMPMQGMILAQLCGVMNAGLYLFAANSPHATLNILVSPGTFARIVRSYRDYPSKHAPATVFNVLSGQLPPILFASFFSVQALGFYSLAQRLIDAPNAILNSAVSVIYYKRMLSAAKSEMSRIFLRTMRWLGLGMIVPLVLLCVFAKPLMSLVFGAQWEQAAVFLVLLLPLLYFRVLYTVGQSLFLVLRQLGNDLWVSAAIFAGTVGGLMGGYAVFGTLEATVGASSVLTAVAYIFGLSLIYRSAKNL